MQWGTGQAAPCARSRPARAAVPICGAVARRGRPSGAEPLGALCSRVVVGGGDLAHHGLPGALSKVGNGDGNEVVAAAGKGSCGVHGQPGGTESDAHAVRLAHSPPPPIVLSPHVVSGLHPSNGNRVTLEGSASKRRISLAGLAVRLVRQADSGPAMGHNVTSYWTQVPPSRGASVGGTSRMTTTVGESAVPRLMGALAAGVTKLLRGVRRQGRLQGGEVCGRLSQASQGCSLQHPSPAPAPHSQRVAGRGGHAVVVSHNRHNIPAGTMEGRHTRPRLQGCGTQPQGQALQRLQHRRHAITGQRHASVALPFRPAACPTPPLQGTLPSLPPHCVVACRPEKRPLSGSNTEEVAGVPPFSGRAVKTYC